MEENPQKLFIKNMVCRRCVLAVEQLLQTLGLQFDKVELGEVFLKAPLHTAQKTALQSALYQLGFEWISDKQSQLISQIKKLVLQQIFYEVEPLKVNFSQYLQTKMGYDYTYLSQLFSSIEGQTLEKYIIEMKMERAKELLVYDELSLVQIAEQLGYSGANVLSGQFKKVTGLSPSHFKKLKTVKRKFIG
jgi:AraC-like DNA-binding protein